MVSPLVSICMSTFNEVADGTGPTWNDSTLAQAIDSLVRQSYQNWELLIVGDCTSHGEKIEALVKSYTASLQSKTCTGRVSFVNQPERSGSLYAGVKPKQEAARRSRGKYIGFLDPDNAYADPDHLLLSVGVLEADPQLDLVYCDSFIELAKPIWKGLRGKYRWRKPQWSGKRKQRLLRSNFIDMSEPIIRRASYDRAGGVKETLPYVLDWCLWRDMLSVGCDRFLHMPHVGLVYRTSGMKHHFQYFMTVVAETLMIPFDLERYVFKHVASLEHKQEKSQQRVSQAPQAV